MNDSATSVYPSTKVTVDSPYEIARWRVFVQWALYIPHYVVTAILSYVSMVTAPLHWLIVLITGKPNKGLYGFNAMILRYEVRAGFFLYGFSEEYPPFAFSQGGADDGAYSPIRLDLPEAPDSISRVSVFNGILAIPHYILIMVYGIGAMFVLMIAWWAVLFTGKWPAGMRDFIVKLSSYYARVWAYTMMTTTEYPSFGLD